MTKLIPPQRRRRRRKQAKALTQIKVNVRLPRWMCKAIDQLSTQYECSSSAIIRTALLRYEPIENLRPKTPPGQDDV